MYNLCKTACLIDSSSTYGVKFIGLSVIGSYLVNMEVKEKLNVEYIEIDPTLLQNPENLLNLAWISNSRRQFYE